MDDVAHVREGYAQDELRVQRCEACGQLQFPPRAVCLVCRSNKLGWVTVSPRGTVATFTVVHRAPTEAFKARVPYAIALIDLAPGVRMMMNVEGEFATLAIGMPVKIDFTGTDGAQRPVARLTAATPGG